LLIHEGHIRARKFFNSANASSYDSVVRLATFGRDFAWKRKIIRAVGSRDSVLELACGTGILSSMLAETGKNLVGIDLAFEYLAASKFKLDSAIAQGTAEVLPYRSELFDAVASSYLAKYVDIESVVNECWRVLRPCGIVVFHDFAYPRGIMRKLWNAHFVVLRLIGRFVTSWRTVLNQLDDVIKNSDWTTQLTNALYKKGFLNVDCRYYTAGTAAIVYAEKP
jgi:demethylmenaquinone methyltransferase / 2-methoxy-6-polyprenyl-1,4-benzoquinol methylase